MLWVQRVQLEQSLPELGKVLSFEISAVRHQVPQQCLQRLYALFFWQGRPGVLLRTRLRHVRDHHDHGVGVGNPHVTDVPIGLQEALVVALQLVIGDAVGSLVQRIPWDHLQRELLHHAQRAQGDPQPAEEAGLHVVLESQYAPARARDLHGGDHLIYRGDPRPGAVGADLGPAGNLLLCDGAEILQGEAVLPKLFEDLRHPGSSLHRDGAGLLVHAFDGIKLHH
mmetsp:Transcript_46416/g.108756  ORF Transcript_46416/g.108756 Transcript_46416/m.108756 type:complete len:225 (+) Transcript_46416:123-797(+)